MAIRPPGRSSSCAVGALCVRRPPRCWDEVLLHGQARRELDALGTQLLKRQLLRAWRWLEEGQQQAGRGQRAEEVAEPGAGRASERGGERSGAARDPRAWTGLQQAEAGPYVGTREW